MEPLSKRQVRSNRWTCRHKIKYYSEQDAIDAQERRKHDNPEKFDVDRFVHYQCGWCYYWHLGNTPIPRKRTSRRLERRNEKQRRKALWKTLDPGTEVS